MTDRRSRSEIGWTGCANCAATVTDALESLDGVSSASVDVATDEAAVRYDPGEASRGGLYEPIESAGDAPVRGRRLRGRRR